MAQYCSSFSAISGKLHSVQNLLIWRQNLLSNHNHSLDKTCQCSQTIYLKWYVVLQHHLIIRNNAYRYTVLSYAMHAFTGHCVQQHQELLGYLIQPYCRLNYLGFSIADNFKTDGVSKMVMIRHTGQTACRHTVIVTEWVKNQRDWRGVLICYLKGWCSEESGLAWGSLRCFASNVKCFFSSD